MVRDIYSGLKGQKSSIVFAILGLALLLGTLSNGNSYIANAQQNASKTGTFNHTQTDESGNPDWINTGNWSLTGIDSPSPTFEAVIDMVKPNGSAAHDHQVSNLVVSGQPNNQNGSTVIDGTTTITMRDGPVTDEPTTITLTGKEISVFFDPAKINNHFGNQPVTGSVTE
ncbi:MAG: hypothetical protein M3162_04535 [Thermoproteota archaeon]|nr:hypothetical protein [Thermoproteota archaeon]